MEPIHSFGYWVRRRRKALDLTQAELARRSACTESLIRKIEADERRPSRALAELLAKELEVPEDERELFLQVARAERSTARLSSPADVPRTALAPTAAAAGVDVPLRASLPAALTPLVGRTRDLADLLGHLRDPACRLVTLVGAGGIGKTRLAVETARAAGATPELREQFADGILFVALDSVEGVAGIVTAIGGAAGFQFFGSLSPRQQLLDYLHDKRVLLVLDNFEHLMEGAGLVSEILAAAPGVKVLVTSRAALNLMEAWIYPVGGLAVPEAAGPETLAEYEAVQLFLQSARRIKGGFCLDNVGEHVSRICRLVEGMPLGIELAAAWLNVLSVEQIAAEIDRSLDILTARYQNLPERHRSMRAVFESSWRLLDDHMREVLSRLAIFRGGFQLEAAQAIAGASIADLATLVEASLLWLTDGGRYDMHGLLRQFALGHLSAQHAARAILGRHSRYYLALPAAHHQAMKGKAQRAALDTVAAELENVRLAWHTAVDHSDRAAIEGALPALYDFFQIRSRYLEGLDLISYTAERMLPPAGAALHDPASRLWIRLRMRQGALGFYLGDYANASAVLEDALHRGRAAHMRNEVAFALNVLGQLAGWQGQRQPARRYLEESLALCEAVDDQAGKANALHKLAQLHGSFGDYEQARQLAQLSLAICQRLGRLDWIGYALDVLGWITVCLGDYTASEAHYLASLAIFEETGDRLGMALALGGLGSVAWALGGDNLEEATLYMLQSLALCRDIGHRHHASSRLWYLSQIAVDGGEDDAAEQWAREGLALAEAVGSELFMAYNMCSLGAVACRRGQYTRAREHFLAVLQLAAAADHFPPMTIALIGLALAWIGEGRESGVAPSRRRALDRRAYETLVVAGRHPGCWAPFRSRTETILADLPVPEEDGASQTEDSDRALRTLVARLLQDETGR
ncbi:MAG: tetratricopeptide repeat protein [Caldilineaceae bacterium]|nr:tetratricopeptide repeat protein [Caldilineaceae bacterium]